MRPCAATLEPEMTVQEHDFLLGLIRAGKLHGKHLEIGTAAGGTLCRMMGCFDDSRRPRFVVVDPMAYFPDQLELVRRNLREHGLDPGRVDFRVKRSADAFHQAARIGERFDFLVIDGSHKIMAVTGDLRWTRLLNLGGVVCLHDYTPRHKGVFYAVNRFLRRYPGYERIGLAGDLLALRKNRTSDHPEITVSDWVYAALWYLPLQVARKLAKRRRGAAASG